MNILLIEDNEFKKKKLYNFLIELQNIKNIDLDFTVLQSQYSLEILFELYAEIQQGKRFVEQNVQTNLILDQLFIKLMNV